MEKLYLSGKYCEIFLNSVSPILATRKVCVVQLEKLINSVFDSDVQDSEDEDVQELEDKFYKEKDSDVVSQIVVTKMLRNRSDQKVLRVKAIIPAVNKQFQKVFCQNEERSNPPRRRKIDKGGWRIKHILPFPKYFHGTWKKNASDHSTPIYKECQLISQTNIEYLFLLLKEMASYISVIHSVTVEASG
ncbi:hypothetical protein C0J52_06435 [Blattella germanica]|nr:hypothetical protein C0J52_06435 [Blattella germanica]